MLVAFCESFRALLDAPVLTIVIVSAAAVIDTGSSAFAAVLVAGCVVAELPLVSTADVVSTEVSVEVMVVLAESVMLTAPVALAVLVTCLPNSLSLAVKILSPFVSP